MSEGHTERLESALSDRYRIERELGAGGMATVYLAEDLKHDRKVAVKVLKPELAAVVGAERFLAEIKTTANLQHPHILPLYDSGQAESFLFFVMPYVAGENLRDRLDREKQLPVEEAVTIARALAHGMDYAHRQGVVHRDIKPANILLQDGEPVVADFGIALAVQEAGGGRLTETGLSVGSPYYMSPEQATADRDSGPRSDVYSLGCVLYEMLTGEPPFTGSTAQAVLGRILTAEPTRPSELRKSVPPWLDEVILHALEKLPADRFGSASELAAALDDGRMGTTARHTKGIRERDRPAGAAGDTTGAVTGTGRNLPWAVAVLAVATAVASWLVRGGSPELDPVRSELEPPPGAAFAEFRFAALSPDGTRLAFVGLRPAGGRVLWIRNLSTARVDSLHTTSGAEAPFWSPDSRSIGYFARGRLWRVEADGSASRPLCDTPDLGGSWNADDQIVFTRGGRPMIVNANGGPCDPVPGTWSDTAQSIKGPVWLPDGQHFAGRAGRDILVSDAAGEASRVLIPGAGDVAFVAPDIALYAKYSSAGSDLAAQRFDPKELTLTGSPTTLARGVRAAGNITSYTVTGSKLVYLPAPRTDVGPLVVDARGVVVDSILQEGTWTFRRGRSHPVVVLGGSGLWQYDLDRGTALSLRAASSAYAFPVWSPGDSLLAVARWPPPSCAVEVLRLLSGTDTTVLDGPRNSLPCPQPTDWTSDGRFLILTISPDHAPDRGEIWTYELATATLEKALSVDGAASSGVVSPDGKWLAYVSNETGELQVYVRPFRQVGVPRRISPDGGGTPRWRADGGALFYITPDGRVVRVRVTAGTDLSLGAPETLFRSPRWSIRLFADQAGGQQITTPFDMSLDGQEFFARPRTEETSAATLIVNWQALLERRTTQ